MLADYANPPERVMACDPTLPSAPAASGARWPLPERYEVLGVLGRGAMGEVLRVLDRHLQVERAMKVLRFEGAEAADARRRFAEEARWTARLAHPGIVSVHELGELSDGRPWFTMDIVAGDTLQAVLDRVHAAMPPDRWSPVHGTSLFRLVDAVGRVAQAVAYAHSRGVVHRDLKPSNVMLGTFGEVVVMDWGVHRAASTAEPAPGAAVGTPGWMPPEQARGELDAMGPASDVYALGALLYGVLAGRPPHAGPGALQALAAGRPPPALTQVTRRPCPEALVALAAQAMHPAPHARLPGAAAFAEAVEAWLEGAQREARGRALVAGALEALPRAATLHDEAERLDRQADRLLDGVEGHEPAARKQPGWRLQDRAAALRREERALRIETMEVVRSALELAPGLPEAHDALADEQRRRVEEAESRGDPTAAEEALATLRRFDRGQHAAFLAGEGWVSLVTEPAGAEVVAVRQIVVDRRTVDGERVPLGITPLERVPLEAGSWRLELRASGRASVGYPVHIGRGQGWHGVPPEGGPPTPIALPPAGALGPDEAYVPAGWFRSGGDPLAPDGLRGRTLWCDAFVVQRHPVTNADYLAFLDALVAEGRTDEALRHVPTETPVGTGAPRPVWALGPDGRHRLAGDSEADALGRAWAPRDPVSLVDHAGAEAYAAWLARHTGRPWRLPHDQEWEKAARGVDGRCYPWGDFFDPSWARMATSQAGGASQVPVDATPDDIGPYGVVGMAGNSRDRCANGYARRGLEGPRVPPVADLDSGWRMIRGGSWFSAPDFCRLAGRGVVRPEERRVGVGFRLVYAWSSAE